MVSSGAVKPLRVSTEESLLDVMARYDKEGFEGQFRGQPDGMVQCLSCRDVTAADQVPVAAMHRFEGTSDPDEQAVLVALECPACGALGTLVLPYGPAGDADEDEILNRLLDERDDFGIRSGT